MRNQDFSVWLHTVEVTGSSPVPPILRPLSIDDDVAESQGKFGFVRNVWRERAAPSRNATGTTACHLRFTQRTL
jgi:hypothetical protein